ncbi:ATP-dependent DNA helicase PIF1, partial [Pyronema domesticum]
TIRCRQFPLCLAHAMIFNSCQGLTLDRVMLDIRIPVFAHGQHYTSLSRVFNRRTVRVLLNEDNEMGDTDNIIYSNLLIPHPL